MNVLDRREIDERLAELNDWAVTNGALSRSFAFGSFRESIAFVNAVADIAERQNHHPDIEVRFTTVRISVVTHSAGGLTGLDFALAQSIDAVSPS